MKNIKFLKEAVVLLILSLLIISNFSATANNQIDSSEEIIQTKISSNEISPLSRGSFDTILDENFTDGNIPPVGNLGIWDMETAGGKTWKIDYIKPNSPPNCTRVRREDNIYQQDECLITPTMDFSIYTDEEIFLDFYFMGDKYTSIWIDNVDYNVSVSVDNGNNWELIWNERDLTWEEWSSGEWKRISDIDITKYKGNSSVLICFQYTTYTDESRESQYFYLDDVRVYTSSDDPLTCDPGGPYEWWWERQTHYLPWGVRFHGSINDGQWWQYKWEWDFGDGNYSNVSTPYAIHFYEKIGTYTVWLRVTHRNTDVFAKASTTVLIYPGQPPEIEIKLKTPSMGIKAELENLADYNATYINWTIEVEWGLLNLWGGIQGEGNIEKLEPGGKQIIESKKYFAGFGLIHIIVTLKPENMQITSEEFYALKFGPFVFGGS
jgi:hypothetical protein